MNDPPRPLQFRIATLLGAMVAVAAVFGTLRGLGVSPTASTVVLVILGVGTVLAIALLATIGGGGGGRNDRT